MATKLEKPVSREVELTDEFGNSGPVVVTVHRDGVHLRGKGTQRTLFVPWCDMVKVVSADQLGRMPARFVGNKIGWLIDRG